MLQLSCLSDLGSLDVVADCNADDDGSCGGGGGGSGGPCLLHGELCCPNDSLDADTVVIEIIQDEELLKDLAVAASLPPTISTGRHHNDENIKSGCCWGVSSAAPRLDVVPTRKRDRSSAVMCGTRSWSLSLDMASIISTRRRSPNDNRRRGNGVRQPQGLVSRQRGPKSIKRLERACSLCDSTQTPHWRSGPDGPGTLCNACGMRYTRQQCKLLLLPEYRPSASQSKKKAWSG